MKAKSRLIYFVSALGLLVASAFGGAFIAGKMMSAQLQTLKTNTTPVRQAYFANNSNAGAGVDFTFAAQKATPAVVHIAAAESDDLARRRIQKRRYSDPFSFFGDRFFGGLPFGQHFFRKSGTGSGVIISKDGYVVTNNHVIEYADKFRVTLPDNRTFDATLVATDPKTDLAVLKIEGQRLPYIEFGDSDALKVGEWVLAVGNPFSYLTSTVTAGIVSAKGRDLDMIGDGRSSIESFIQTDAAINGGNSGGALVDLKGRLVGINTAIATPTGAFAGYAFAIPVNLMKKIVNDLIEYGSPRRGYLGIDIVDVDDELAKEYKLNTTEGVLVYDLVEGGSAENAGLLPNDVIIEVNNIRIESVAHLREYIMSKDIGETLDLSIIRGGKLLSIAVPISAR